MARMPKVALPASTPSDSPLVSICVNRDWLSIMHTCLTRLEWGASWREGTDIDQAEQMAFELYDRLRNISSCGNDMAQLRQNPSNSCQLQQSFDGGISWELAFDFSLCQPKPSMADNITVYRYYLDTLNEYNETWIDSGEDVSIFAPVTNYNGSANDLDRDRALCTAINLFVETLKEVTRRSRDNAVTDLAAPVAGAVLAGLATAWNLGASFPVLVGALGTLLTKVAFVFSGELAVQELEDNKDLIICTMYDALKGQTITATAFGNSLNSLPELEYDVTQVLQQAIANLDVFLTFVKVWEESYRYAVSGIYLDCPCLETWEHTFDFTVNDGGFSLAQYCSGNNIGVYSSGAWRTVGGLRFPGCVNIPNHRMLDIGITAPQPYNLTSVEIDYSGVVVGGGYTSLEMFGMDTMSGGTFHDNQVFLQQPPPSGTGTFTWSGDVTIVKSILRMRLWTTSTTATGTGAITRLKLTGTGTNPFI